MKVVHLFNPSPGATSARDSFNDATTRWYICADLLADAQKVMFQHVGKVYLCDSLSLLLHQVYQVSYAAAYV